MKIQREGHVEMKQGHIVIVTQETLKFCFWLIFTGSTFQMKGTILELCFLNYNGLLIPVEAEVWSEGRDSSDKREKRKNFMINTLHCYIYMIIQIIPPYDIPIILLYKLAHG